MLLIVDDLKPLGMSVCPSYFISRFVLFFFKVDSITPTFSFFKIKILPNHFLFYFGEIMKEQFPYL